MLILLAFLSFATYHQGTGGVMWVQFLSVLTIFSFVFIFDWAFTNENNFMFDPDADNWRRKVVSILYTFHTRTEDSMLFFPPLPVVLVLKSSH